MGVEQPFGRPRLLVVGGRSLFAGKGALQVVLAPFPQDGHAPGGRHEGQQLDLLPLLPGVAQLRLLHQRLVGQRPEPHLVDVLHRPESLGLRGGVGGEHQPVGPRQIPLDQLHALREVHRRGFQEDRHLLQLRSGYGVFVFIDIHLSQQGASSAAS